MIYYKNFVIIFIENKKGSDFCMRNCMKCSFAIANDCSYGPGCVQESNSPMDLQELLAIADKQNKKASKRRLKEKMECDEYEGLCSE